MSRALYLAVLLTLMLPAPALAHAMLEHASPAAGAAMHNAPAEVHLEFSERLDPASSDIAVADSAGQSVIGGVTVVKGKSMIAKLTVLGAGEYRVQWHALSADGHRTEGSYAFRITP